MLAAIGSSAPIADTPHLLSASEIYEIQPASLERKAGLGLGGSQENAQDDALLKI